jgi:hypothetical protein
MSNTNPKEFGLVPGRTYRLNLGSVKLKRDRSQLLVEYRGNMGSTVDREVNQMLDGLGLPSVGELKANYATLVEWGSPDYQWELRIVL